MPDLGGLLKAVNSDVQSTDVVARAAAYLMVDGKRSGDLVFVWSGRYKEIEQSILVKAYDEVRGEAERDDDVLARIMALG